MVDGGEGVPTLLVTAGLQYGLHAVLVHGHSDGNALKSGDNLTGDNTAFTGVNGGDSGLALIGEHREGLGAGIEEQRGGRSKVGESELALRKRLHDTPNIAIPESTHTGYRGEPRWSR